MNTSAPNLDISTKAPTRKIGPSVRASVEAAMPPGELNMHALGPGDEVVREWTDAGLLLPDFAEMRRYRMGRIREELKRRDYAGIVLYDPVNLRYAIDSTNMQVWSLHNACRYVFIPTEGPVVLWEFDHCDFLSHHTESVDEIRPCVPWFHFCAGDRALEQVARWAGEMASLVRKHGGDNLRLAMDHCDPEGVAALERLGVSVHNGEGLMEEARRIKCADEVRAMRCAIHACEAGMKVMHERLKPGITEQRL